MSSPNKESMDGIKQGENRENKEKKRFSFLPFFLAFDFVALVLIVLMLSGVFSSKEEEPYVIRYEQVTIMEQPDFLVSVQTMIEEEAIRANQERFDESVFLGDSLTEGLGIYGYVNTSNVVANRGLNIENATKRVKKIVKKKPSYVFIMLGINDLNNSAYSMDDIEDNYCKLIEKLHGKLPETKIYVQSLLPVTAKFEKDNKALSNRRINKLNKRLKKISESYDYTVYVDIHSRYVNKKGCLPAKISSDGYHLTIEAYQKWMDYVKNEMNK